MTNSHGALVRSTTSHLAKSLISVAASVLMIGAISLISTTPASAAGTTANAITVGSAPGAGSARGSYTPTATATSRDKVVVTLDKTSTGCSISSDKVTFTTSGTCVIDFNDAGTTTYAAATQVQQSIKVYSSNTITASTPPSAGSAGGSYSPGATATSSDGVVKTLSSTSTGCTISSGKVTFTGVGTCHVLFNDAGNGAFAPAGQLEQSVKVYADNLIHASTPPAAGTIHGTYSASARATSGDTVDITLDGSSTGCTLYKGKVTFTDNGYCRVNFNDPGNGAFAAAAQVQQTIIVGTGGLLTQATLSLFTTGGSYGKSLVLLSSGGSGTGAVTFAVTTIGTAGCSITNGTLSATRVGTCSVTVSKAGDATYKSATSLATTVSISAHYPRKPKASRVGSAVWTGKTTVTEIIGAGFYGRPRVSSNVFGTRVVVTRDSGRVLTVHVSVASSTPRGVHTFRVVFAHGERTSVRYNQR